MRCTWFDVIFVINTIVVVGVFSAWEISDVVFSFVWNEDKIFGTE